MTAQRDDRARPLGALVIAAACLVFLATVLVTLPASVLAGALGKQGIQTTKLSGSVWRGHLEHVVVDGFYVGDIRYRLAPLSLLAGKIGGDIVVRGGPLSYDGAITIGLLNKTVSARKARLDFQLASLSQYSVFGLPYSGRLQADIVRLDWARDGCAAAEAMVRTDILDQPVTQLIGEGLRLEGGAYCDRKALAFELTGDNSQAGTVISIVLAPDMSYELAATVRTEKGQIETSLVSLGFEEQGDTLVYRAIGELRGAGL